MQTGYEGCIFLSPNRQVFSKICTLSVEREPIRAPLSMLWSGTSSTYIYETPKSSYFPFKKDKHTCDNISGRYASVRSNNPRIDYDQRYCDFSIIKSWVHNQSKEISIHASSENRISGGNDRLIGNDIITTLFLVDMLKHLYALICSKAYFHLFRYWNLSLVTAKENVWSVLARVLNWI